MAKLFPDSPTWMTDPEDIKLFREFVARSPLCRIMFGTEAPYPMDDNPKEYKSWVRIEDENGNKATATKYIELDEFPDDPKAFDSHYRFAFREAMYHWARMTGNTIARTVSPACGCQSVMGRSIFEEIRKVAPILAHKSPCQCSECKGFLGFATALAFSGGIVLAAVLFTLGRILATIFTK